MGSDSAAEAGQSGAAGSGFTAISFSDLYEALGRRLANERIVLLLYDALHTCGHFQNYVLVRRWAFMPSFCLVNSLFCVHSIRKVHDCALACSLPCQCALHLSVLPAHRNLLPRSDVQMLLLSCYICCAQPQEGQPCTFNVLLAILLHPAAYRYVFP